MGYALDGINEENQPLNGLPAPDFLISFGAGCIPTMKAFQVLCDHFKVPVFRADLPQVAMEKIEKRHIAYAVTQIKRLIRFLEDETGLKFDIDKLRQAVIHTNEACRLWDEIMATRSTIPLPVFRRGDRHHVCDGDPARDRNRREFSERCLAGGQ